MDSEPGRCRRTDGRKWRCSRRVVPGQKYCERHVHRGRQGSRKHVEPTESIAKSDDNKIPDHKRASVIPSPTTGVDNRIDVSDEGDRNPTQHCCGNGNDLPTIVVSGSNEVVTDSTILGLEVNKNNSRNCATTNTSAISIKNGVTDGVDSTNGKKGGFGNVNPMKISRRKQSVTKNSYHGFSSPGFGLSPKSVLHCGVAGKVGLGLDSKSIAESDQQRCKRTDGKKWQCRRDAVLGQKYCEAHMHRGAKKIMLNLESGSNVLTYSARNAYVPVTVAGHPDDRINLNTIPGSPHHATGNNSTSSTSDATTISDENISFCRNHHHHRRKG